MTIVFIIFIVLAIFVVSYSLSVIVHELSHLTAAILCKQKPKFFLVGFSKSRFNCLFSFNLFDVKFFVNPFINGGGIESSSYMGVLSKTKQLFMYFSGPFSNLVLFFVFIPFLLKHNYVNDMHSFLQLENFSSILNIAIWIFLFLNLFFFIGNMIPIKGSDGWFIKEILLNRNPDFNASLKDFEKLVTKDVYLNFIAPKI